MIRYLKTKARAVIDYLGDAAHRRFVATIVALGATHLIGHALDADSVSTAIGIAIGGLGGAWSSTTPKLEGE